MGKWIFEKITSANEPEKEIPLSPFPIKQPVVYHFNPVAFVEQMRRMIRKEDINSSHPDKKKS